jgi:hypothetical protein
VPSPYFNPVSKTFDAAVFEAQRRYEALLLLTQGYVMNPGLAPVCLQFQIEQPDQYGNVRVVDQFPTAPLVGYLNGNLDRLPVEITVGYDESARLFSVMAKLQSAVIPRKGAVLTLVWPNGKTLTSSELIKRPKQGQKRKFSLLTPEAPYDTTIDVVSIQDEPLEVWIGNLEISDDDVRWEKNLLSIRVPSDVEARHVIVVTSAGIWMSDTPFRPMGLPTSKN